MEKEELEVLIRTAFQSVVLGNGTSLRQAEIMDNYGEDSSGKRLGDTEFLALKRQENTEDWPTLTSEYLENHPYHSYLDAEGFRYYIPACMLASLKGSVCVEWTLYALRPTRDDSWKFYMDKYALLDAEQRHAVAKFLEWLPYLIDFDTDELKSTERPLRDYWGQFLAVPPPAPEIKRKVKRRKKR